MADLRDKTDFTRTKQQDLSRKGREQWNGIFEKLKVNGKCFRTRICIWPTSIACRSCFLCPIRTNQISLEYCAESLAARGAAKKKIMSVKKSLSLTKADDVKRGAAGRHDAARKRRRSFDLCFANPELPMERGKSLKDVDSEKLKAGIRKWAKAVVAYARQVSGRLGSWRRTPNA